jgi:hypothetical protein
MNTRSSTVIMGGPTPDQVGGRAMTGESGGGYFGGFVTETRCG